jgi:hypothetical protein
MEIGKSGANWHQTAGVLGRTASHAKPVEPVELAEKLRGKTADTWKSCGRNAWTGLPRWSQNDKRPKNGPGSRRAHASAKVAIPT